MKEGRKPKYPENVPFSFPPPSHAPPNPHPAPTSHDELLKMPHINTFLTK